MEPLYEFNFDELTAGDILVIARVMGNLEDWSSLADMIELASRHTNTNVKALRFEQLNEFFAQFVAAINEYFRALNKVKM